MTSVPNPKAYFELSVLLDFEAIMDTVLNLSGFLLSLLSSGLVSQTIPSLALLFFFFLHILHYQDSLPNSLLVLVYKHFFLNDLFHFHGIAYHFYLKIPKSLFIALFSYYRNLVLMDLAFTSYG